MNKPDQADRSPSVTKEDLAVRAAGHGADAEVIGELLKRRYSCRGFLPKPVPSETIADLLALVQLSASWCNSQPWEVIVTQPAATDRFRAALRTHAEAAAPASDIAFPVEYRGVYKVRQRECGWQLYESVGVELGDRAGSRQQALRNFELFGAQHVLIITTPEELGAYGAVDCGSFIAAFMLVAESFGIASIAQAALAMHSDFLRQWFDIPPTRHVVCGISFGYADDAHPANAFRTYRAEPTSITRWIEG